MSFVIENGHFSRKRGPKPTVKPRNPDQRYPFDTREFIDDVAQLQKEVKDLGAAKALIVLTLKMVKESLALPQEREAKKGKR